MQELANSVSNQSKAVVQQKLNVGVLQPPEKLARPELYSDKKAKKEFSALTADIYEHKNKVDYQDTKKTPKGIIAASITAFATAVAVVCVKANVYSKMKSVLKL